MSFKTVICCINSKYIHSSLAPWCLYAGVRAYCHGDITAGVTEGTINETVEAILSRILAEEPDAVGFCCYIWNISFVKTLAEKVKKALPDVKIIFGGPEVSFNSEQILNENDFVDFVLCGEGEEAFPALLNALSAKQAPPQFLASARKDGKILLGEHHICKSELSPYCEEYFHALDTRIAYIESSRGCPYHCAFCLSGEDRNVRFFDLERIKAEMLSLCAAGTKTIKFVDRTFNCNRKRAMEILSFIKEHYGKTIPDDVCFHFEIAADILSEEMLRLIQTMPCGSVQFEAGIQTFNPTTLAEINRKTDIERLCKNLTELISFQNCHVHIDLIAGLVSEDMQSFKESFDRAYALKANMLQLGFLKILHGSQMEIFKEKYPCIYHDEPPYEVISTPWLRAEELDLLRKTEDALERLYNSGRFKRTLEYLLSASGASPFKLFADFGEYAAAKNEKQPSLDRYTEWVFEYFKEYPHADPMRLRDTMLTDRMATNSSDILPACLRVEDPNLKKAKQYLYTVDPPKKGIRRTVAIHYTDHRILYCDYGKKNPVSGEYSLKYEQIINNEN